MPPMFPLLLPKRFGWRISFWILRHSFVFLELYNADGFAVRKTNTHIELKMDIDLLSKDLADTMHISWKMDEEATLESLKKDVQQFIQLFDSMFSRFLYAFLKHTVLARVSHPHVLTNKYIYFICSELKNSKSFSMYYAQ